jgi:hypothetical protein
VNALSSSLPFAPSLTLPAHPASVTHASVATIATDLRMGSPFGRHNTV